MVSDGRIRCGYKGSKKARQLVKVEGQDTGDFDGFPSFRRSNLASPAMEHCGRSARKVNQSRPFDPPT